MTNTVFITGDRRMAPFYPQQVAMEMLRAAGQGKKISTGTNPGVEEVVRAFGEQAGIDVQVVEHNTLPNGKPDFEVRAQALSILTDIDVVAIHADPHSSHIVRPLVTFLGEKLRLVTPADLLP